VASLSDYAVFVYVQVSDDKMKCHCPAAECAKTARQNGLLQTACNNSLGPDKSRQTVTNVGNEATIVTLLTDKIVFPI